MSASIGGMAVSLPEAASPGHRAPEGVAREWAVELGQQESSAPRWWLDPPPSTPLTATTAAPPPDHKDGGNRSLGNGLGRLVAEEESTGTTFRSTSGVRIDPDALSIRDSQGRVMVQLTPQAGVDRAGFRKQAEARGLRVKAVDRASGTLEGFVEVSSIHALAS